MLDENQEKTEIGDVADAIESLARAVNNLGNGDSSSPIGGLENLSMMIESAGDDIAEAIKEAGEDISRGLQYLADSIRYYK